MHDAVKYRFPTKQFDEMGNWRTVNLFDALILNGRKYELRRKDKGLETKSTSNIWKKKKGVFIVIGLLRHELSGKSVHHAICIDHDSKMIRDSRIWSLSDAAEYLEHSGFRVRMYYQVYKAVLP